MSPARTERILPEWPATAAAREARQVGGADLGRGLAERVDGGQPARAEDQRDVVALDAGQLGEPSAASAASSYGVCWSVTRHDPSAVGCVVGRIGRMIDHFGINCADLTRAGGVLRQGPRRPRLLAGHRLRGRARATAPDKPDFWIGTPARRGPGVRPQPRGPRRVRAPPTPTPSAPSSTRPSLGAEVLHEPRHLAGVPRPLLRRFVRDPDGNNVEAVCHTVAPVAGD